MSERVACARQTADVQAAVIEAAADNLNVRAVGSGHSFTGAAVAPGVQLELDRLARLLDVDAATGLVTVEAGMPLHRLNVLLAEHGLAMPNLGDIDRQTIAGAISHGHARHRGPAAGSGRAGRRARAGQRRRRRRG